MLQWIKPKSEDYEYAVATFKASYWYRQAAIAQDDGKLAVQQVCYQRGRFYDGLACKRDNTREAWMLYDHAYKSWRENGCSSAMALQIIRMLETAINGF